MSEFASDFELSRLERPAFDVLPGVSLWHFVSHLCPFDFPLDFPLLSLLLPLLENEVTLGK